MGQSLSLSSPPCASTSHRQSMPILRRIHAGQVIVINLFLGWTFIGWVSALVAARATKIYIDPPQVNHYYQAPSPQLAGPPAGWYDNPSGSGQKYRDGRAWTE